jgi:hypothetical protein
MGIGKLLSQNFQNLSCSCDDHDVKTVVKISIAAASTPRVGLRRARAQINDPLSNYTLSVRIANVAIIDAGFPILLGKVNSERSGTEIWA